jgi:hypothetical protein
VVGRRERRDAGRRLNHGCPFWQPAAQLKNFTLSPFTFEKLAIDHPENQVKKFLVTMQGKNQALVSLAK